MRRAFLACLCLTRVSLVAGQTDPVAASRGEYQQAVAAYQAHDYPAFLSHASRAADLRPSHGGVIYGLASAYALTGDTVRAVEALRRFASLGYYADVSADSDLVALRRSKSFAAVRRRLEGNRAPVVRSTVAFTLPETDLLTEGIAYDPGSRTFFVGSVHQRKIMRVAGDGRATEFVQPACTE